MIHIIVSESFYYLQYQVFSQRLLQLEDLVNSFNNQNKTYMKNNLIQQFQHLKDGQFIQTEFYLVQNNNQTINIL